MDLIVKNKVVSASVREIIETLRAETGYKYFKTIKGNDNDDKLMVTCPWHKGGQENHPSCCVTNTEYSDKYEKGFFYCFTCGKRGKLTDVIAHCLNDTEEVATDWLAERFGDIFIEKQLVLTDIDLDKKEKKYMNESILNKYNYYNDYMWKRKLSKEIVDKFEVGYDKDERSITFPVRDISGRLQFITERSIDGKFFKIPDSVDKPVYLLYEVVKNNYPFVIVCEGQIDALTCWTYGVPAVALFGVGSDTQYEILNKSGVRSWVTFFDNDDAGRKATKRFNKNIRKDVLVTNLSFGNINKKDINDLTIQEFDEILDKQNLFFRINR